MSRNQDVSIPSTRQTFALIALRVAIGNFFVFKGLGKIGWVFDPSLLADRLNAWLQHATVWNRWYLTSVMPGAPVLARLVVFGELAGGLALICGFWTRPIAALILFMVLNFHVATAAIFDYAFLTDGSGLPVVGGLLALAMAGSATGFRMIRHERLLVLAMLLIGTAGCGTESPETAKPASVPPIEAPVAAVYVTNETSGDLSVIDATTQTVVHVVPLGKRPRGIAAAPDGNTLYVALSGSPPAPPGVDEGTLPPPDRTADGIGVIDIRQMKLLKVLPSGTDPEVVAVSHDGTRLFVANEDAAKASVIDVSTGEILETFPIGEEPEGVTVQPGVDRVWVTSEEAGEVFVIDLTTHKVLTSIPVGSRPRSIAFLPDGSRAYVPSENGATVTVIDTTSFARVKTITLEAGMRPMGTAMSRDGKHLYVTTGRSKMLLVLDTGANAVVGSVEAGARPWGIALAPDGTTAYTANGPSNEVAVIDLAARRVTHTIPVGQGPWGAVFVQRPAAPAAR